MPGQICVRAMRWRTRLPWAASWVSSTLPVAFTSSQGTNSPAGPSIPSPPQPRHERSWAARPYGRAQPAHARPAGPRAGVGAAGPYAGPRPGRFGALGRRDSGHHPKHQTAASVASGALGQPAPGTRGYAVERLPAGALLTIRFLSSALPAGRLPEAPNHVEPPWGESSPVSERFKACTARSSSGRSSSTVACRIACAVSK